MNAGGTIKMKALKLLPLFLFSFSFSSFSAGAHTRPVAHPRVVEATWLEDESPIAVGKVLQNISPADALPGAVIAAPTRENPNYYYHWVRDAGLVITAMTQQYELSRDPVLKSALNRKFTEYLSFSDRIQRTRTLTGLGEPKFNVDGSAYNDPWGRPQNDSPALRAVSLIRWAQILIAEGRIDFVRARLYTSQLPADSVIKRDLEYVSHHWREPSFDLWEEVKGDHFYTRMVQRRAMIEGAELASTLGDAGAANWYASQAKEIENTIADFWDAQRGYFVATRNQVEGLSYKSSGLDTAVILGLLHGSVDDGFLPFTDRRVQATLNQLTHVFAQTYTINRRSQIPGVAVGRYPEDLYGGSNFNAGNPWPLCTLAIAEAYYHSARELQRNGNKGRAAEATSIADQFVARVKYHAHADGSLNEQIDRNSGYMTSVDDLTWNYAAILTAAAARNAVSR